MLQDEWFNLICESYLKPPVIFNSSELPKFPSDQVQIRTTGQAGIATLKEAFIFYNECLNNFNDFGKPIKSNHNLLDFGAGWGRISRFFIKEIPVHHIYGIDVMQEFIEMCKHDFNSQNFFVTNPYPPTLFTDAKFDFIIGYSVFSHLSEKACELWMAEFNRILKPGGIVALTTRGRDFFDHCESLKIKGPAAGYSLALSEMFDNFDDARKRYDMGEFIHSNNSGLSGGGAMTAEFYGETFIPHPYAKQKYSAFFNLEKFLYNPNKQSQPIMFFRKIVK